MRHLFVLRPEPAASETIARAAALGIEAVAAPLFEIEPVAWAVPDPAAFDGLLLTSANAVRFAGPSLTRVRALPVLAVGEATARAAREAGLAVEQAGSSGVDQLLGSIAKPGRLLHLCGVDRRTPTAWRQSIVAVTVYRSLELPAPPEIERIGGAVVAVHSPRAGERLAALVGRDKRASVRVAAISAAAAEAAGDGWESVGRADAVGDEPLLALAARLCQNAACDDRGEPNRA